ncbi:hypothetical protein OF83DRAFT_1089483, partial [Amylostereum chailletii]
MGSTKPFRGSGNPDGAMYDQKGRKIFLREDKTCAVLNENTFSELPLEKWIGKAVPFKWPFMVVKDGESRVCPTDKTTDLYIQIWVEMEKMKVPRLCLSSYNMTYFFIARENMLYMSLAYTQEDLLRFKVYVWTRMAKDRYFPDLPPVDRSSWPKQVQRAEEAGLCFPHTFEMEVTTEMSQGKEARWTDNDGGDETVTFNYAGLAGPTRDGERRRKSGSVTAEEDSGFRGYSQEDEHWASSMLSSSTTRIRRGDEDPPLRL